VLSPDSRANLKICPIEIVIHRIVDQAGEGMTDVVGDALQDLKARHVNTDSSRKVA